MFFKISKNTKMRLLYTSTVIPSAIYASETWRTTDKTNRMLSVFNRRCLRDIMGVSLKDGMTNEELPALETYRTLWQTGGDDSSGMYCASRHHDQLVW